VRPKILLVADTYHPKVDGTLRFIEEFIPRAKDFAVSLLVPNYGKRKHRVDVEKITFLDNSRFIKLSGYHVMKLSWKNVKKIREAIRENDIIFVQGPALISYLAMYYGRILKKKTVTYVHVITWELYEKFLPPLINKLFHGIIKRVSIWLFNLCDLVLVPYRGLQRDLKKSGISTPMQIARLGVDINRFSPEKNKEAMKQKLKIKQGTFVVGYVGRISKEKNVDVLVDAFARIDVPNKLLLLVGDGDTKHYTNYEHIKITGFVDNVQDYLKTMDIFVMPSLTETTSLATLEAMSTGLPVVVTQVGMMKEYISRNFNGLFFPRDNPAILSLKLEKLYKDEILRRKLGKQARRTVAYSFSWERSINKIKRILKKLE
tara:strand:+ start:2417 stop:3538 length:1122 start_codon:yes stop_codon:yes gene_type:complete